LGLSINNENFFSFIRHKTGKNDLTLKELYDLSNISLIVKVYNIDRGKTDFKIYYGFNE